MWTLKMKKEGICFFRRGDRISWRSMSTWMIYLLSELLPQGCLALAQLLSLNNVARLMNNTFPFGLAERLLYNMRLHERLIRPFQAPATVQNFSGSQVFLFRSSGQSDSEDSSEEEFNATELRARGKDPQPSSSSQKRVGDVQLLERVVKEDDNLNKLALQYGCKVSSSFFGGEANGSCFHQLDREAFYFKPGLFTGINFPVQDIWRLGRAIWFFRLRGSPRCLLPDATFGTSGWIRSFRACIRPFND